MSPHIVAGHTINIRMIQSFIAKLQQSHVAALTDSAVIAPFSQLRSPRGTTKNDQSKQTCIKQASQTSLLSISRRNPPPSIRPPAQRPALPQHPRPLRLNHRTTTRVPYLFVHGSVVSFDGGRVFYLGGIISALHKENDRLT